MLQIRQVAIRSSLCLHKIWSRRQDAFLGSSNAMDSSFNKPPGVLQSLALLRLQAVGKTVCASYIPSICRQGTWSILSTESR